MLEEKEEKNNNKILVIPFHTPNIMLTINVFTIYTWWGRKVPPYETNPSQLNTCLQLKKWASRIRKVKMERK